MPRNPVKTSIQATFALAAVAFFTAPAAQAQVFECDVQGYGKDGWIPPLLMLELDRKTNSGFAYDAYIHSVYKEPIPANVEARSNGSYRFTWVLQGVKTSNDGSTKLSHAVILNTNTMKMTMSGRLHGADNVISGRGTCKLAK